MAAVLGLSDKGDVDWARLRGLQYSALAKLAFYQVFSHALLAVFTAQIFIPSVGFLGVAAWMALLAVVQVRGYKIDRALADTERRRITRAEFKQQTGTAMMSAAVWAGAVVVFPFFGTPGDLMAMLMIVAVMVVGSVFFYTAAPVGILCFIGIVGAAAMLHLGLAG